MGKDSDTLAGILLGILGIALLASIFGKKCKVLEQSLPLGKWNTEGWKGVKIEWSELLKYTPTNASEKLSKIFEIVKRNFE